MAAATRTTESVFILDSAFIHAHHNAGTPAPPDRADPVWLSQRALLRRSVLPLRNSTSLEGQYCPKTITKIDIHVALLYIEKYFMNIASYARVSTKDRGQDTENQLLQLRQFCHQQGWTVVQEYVDQESAAHFRPGRL